MKMWKLELCNLDCLVALFTTELKVRDFLTDLQDKLLDDGFNPEILEEYELCEVDVNPDVDTWYEENV